MVFTDESSCTVLCRKFQHVSQSFNELKGEYDNSKLLSRKATIAGGSTFPWLLHAQVLHFTRYDGGNDTARKATAMTDTDS
jgi:hypothetical protein